MMFGHDPNPIFFNKKKRIGAWSPRPPPVPGVAGSNLCIFMEAWLYVIPPFIYYKL